MSSSVRPLSYAAFPDEASAGLRTSLRNVPMLPAPSNVDDLIARLDSEDVPFSSGPLAAMICDARAPDLEPLAPDLYGWEEPDPDSFFAPLALAANSNVASSRPQRSRSLAAIRRALATALLAGACLLAFPVAPTQDVPPPRAVAPILDVPELAATALGVPSELVAQEVAAHEPPPMQASPAAVEAATAAVADWADPIASEEPKIPVASAEKSKPAADLESSSATDAESVGAEPTVATETPSAEPLDDGADDAPAIEMSESAPLPPSRPVDPASVPFAGQWATSAKACTPAMQERGALLADIDGNRGRAGNTTCTFKTIEQRGNTWKIAAVCSNGRSSWKSNVRLTLDRGRLTWASRKGTVGYVRCQSA